MIPGEVVPRAGEITLNAGREAVTLAVANTGDRPVQVGSHYHFLETNAALAFDRARPVVGGSTFRPARRSASSPTKPARCTIYVIDVAAGDKIPRKGGPGITRSDLLVINKTDLAPLVVADLGVMARDARRMRGERPFVFTNIRSGEGVATVADFITMMGGLAAPAP